MGYVRAHAHPSELMAETASIWERATALERLARVHHDGARVRVVDPAPSNQDAGPEGNHGGRVVLSLPDGRLVDASAMCASIVKLLPLARCKVSLDKLLNEHEVEVHLSERGERRRAQIVARAHPLVRAMLAAALVCLLAAITVDRCDCTKTADAGGSETGGVPTLLLACRDAWHTVCFRVCAQLGTSR